MVKRSNTIFWKKVIVMHDYLSDKKSLRLLLHYLSVSGMWLLVYGTLYVLQDLTLGMIPMIKELKVEGIPVKLFIFSFVALFIMKRYIKISSPYK